MKKILLSAAFIAASFTSIAQVGVGTTDPNASAALEVKSTTKGFLPPRMTTANRDAITTPPAGLVIYNTTVACVQFFNGALWFDTCTQTTDGPPNTYLTVGNISYQGTSVIGTTGIGYNGEAVPAGSTITVELTNSDTTEQVYGLSATDADSGLIYSTSGTIAASATNFAVTLTPNAVVMPALESGVLSMTLKGASNEITLEPRIDIKSIPASATTVKGVFYGTQIWMDRNLGARRVATDLNDVFSYGNHYQWGRPGNGHEITVWNGTSRTTGRGLADFTADLAGDDIPEHDNFIVIDSSPNNWLASPATAATATLWATANQGPCPANYHVPTEDEWDTADAFNPGWGNSTDTYNSTLKLPSSGFRTRTDGTLSNQGSNGSYWSSAVSGDGASNLTFNITIANTRSSTRANGFTVRCLKD
jgi:uncharacterized protein (TIGR02145 family)